MRTLWFTDPHFNFIDADAVDLFLDRVHAQQPDTVLITGDFGEAHTVVEYLQQIDAKLQCPIYFVLGNHDFYFGSIAEVRREVTDLCRQCENLTYLSAVEFELLTPSVAVMGHDGWADGRIGDYERSYIMMNDYRLIHELASFSKQDRLVELNRMGDEAASHVRRALPSAMAAASEVVLLTHVPPLREACWHEGSISDDEWAPHFTCKAVGDAILEIMPRFPDHTLTVLCGHTHGRGETHPLPNVRILTGAAQYGKPDIEQIFQFR